MRPSRSRARTRSTPSSRTSSNLGDIVPDDFVLSDGNIAQVQAEASQPQWHDARSRPLGRERQGRCRQRRVHEGLRHRGPPRFGVSGVRPRLPRRSFAAKPPGRCNGGRACSEGCNASGRYRSGGNSTGRLGQVACLACHGIDKKIVGPAFKDVAARYRGDASAAAMLAGKIRNGSTGAWGPVPMPANSVTAEEAAALAQWVQGL